jgi:hypothetical protein
MTLLLQSLVQIAVVDLACSSRPGLTVEGAKSDPSKYDTGRGIRLPEKPPPPGIGKDHPDDVFIRAENGGHSLALIS